MAFDADAFTDFITNFRMSPRFWAVMILIALVGGFLLMLLVWLEREGKI